MVSAIPVLFEQYDFNDLTIWALRHDKELIQMFSERGLKSRKSNLRGHTFKFTNFPRLMQRFRPYIEERVGMKMTDSLEFKQEGDNFSIKLGDEEFSTDGVSAVLIVFGSCDSRERELMPKSGKIAEALEAIFPLPFIWPGLDSF